MKSFFFSTRTLHAFVLQNITIGFCTISAVRMLFENSGQTGPKRGAKVLPLITRDLHYCPL